MNDPAPYVVRNLRAQPVEVHTGRGVVVLPPRGTHALTAQERATPQLRVLERRRLVVVRARGPATPGGAVHLNTATTEELEALDGVSAAQARAIVAHRDAHGPFADVDALEAVRGVGPATVRALRDHVVADR